MNSQTGSPASVRSASVPSFQAKTNSSRPRALLIAAAFWTWLWGPIGLALATPLTVCLEVFSRTVAGLEFIEILVSSRKSLDGSLTGRREPPHALLAPLDARCTRDDVRATCSAIPTGGQGPG